MGWFSRQAEYEAVQDYHRAKLMADLAWLDSPAGKAWIAGIVARYQKDSEVQ